jgi:hypothetical protein
VATGIRVTLWVKAQNRFCLTFLTVALLRPMAFAAPRVYADECEVGSLLTRCHPFRQQTNGMLVQSTCNSTKQPKVRRRLEE